MNPWDVYTSRLNTMGSSLREASLMREKRLLSLRLPNNLSYDSVYIDGVKQELAIVNSDNVNVKSLHSLPGEDIKLGGTVFFMGKHWLIDERDAKNEVYTTAKMTMCNHLLKWVTDDGIIHEQWSIVEDATNYLTGEYEDRDLFVTRGDTRIVLIVPRNEFTAVFSRDNRFLIDDEMSRVKMAYQLTKPFKLYGVYGGEGVYKFILQEIASTDFDNHELGIADYYRYFPKESSSGDLSFGDNTSADVGNGDSEAKGEGDTPRKKVWI